MRKFITILLSITMAISLVACNDKNVKNNDTNIATEENQTKEETIPVVALGQVYQTDKYEITIHGYSWTNKIEPKNPAEFYSYYEADENSTMLMINASIKNVGSEAVNIDSISYEASINDTYKYKLQTAIEKNGDLGGLAMVKPLEQVDAIIFTSIPNEAKNSLETIKLFCGYNDDYDNQFDTFDSNQPKIEFALQ